MIRPRWLAPALFLFPLAAFASELRSPLNPHAASEAPAVGEPYTVWVSGRAQGRSIFPVASLLANAKRPRERGARALFLIDDGLEHDAARRGLAQFDVPVFQLPGSRAGGARTAAPFALRLGGDLWLAAGSASPGWVAGLKTRLRAAAADPSLSAVFVLSLPLVWSGDEPAFAALRAHAGPKPASHDGFARDLVPVLADLAATRPVVWISGDLRGFPPFHHRTADGDLRFVAIGLSGDENDALLEVRSDGQGEVDLALRPLAAGRDLGPLEQFGDAYWRTYHESRWPWLWLDTPRDLRWSAAWMFATSTRFAAGTLLGVLLILGARSALRRLRG